MTDDPQLDPRLDATRVARDDPATADPDRSSCLRCGTPIRTLGSHELRTGGSTGAIHLLIGQWAELGEGKLRVEILECPGCGHVELRRPTAPE